MQASKSDRKARSQAKAKNTTKSRSQSGMKKKEPRQQSVAAAYSTQVTNKAPQMRYERDAVVVSHKEFIANVTGSVNFAVPLTFNLNPGLAATFPWLSGIAQNFESYRFRSLTVSYKTRTGTGIPGSVYLAYDPDASDSAPASEAIMSSYSDMKEDSPWRDITMSLNPAALHKLGPQKFVRTGALAANQDIKLYDAGLVSVGTVDGTAVSWGKVWVKYEVELRTPQIPAAGAFGPGSMCGDSTVSGASIASGAGFGVNIGNRYISGALISSIAADNNTVNLTGLIVGQEYVISYGIVGGTSCAYAGAGTFTGATLKTSFRSTAVQTTPSSFSATYTATATSGSFAIGALTIVGTPTQVNFSIAPVPVSTL